MTRKKGTPKVRGRKTLWTDDQVEFLEQHRDAYSQADAKNKSAFWRALFPLWFSMFPCLAGNVKETLWTLHMPDDEGEEEDEDAAEADQGKTAAEVTIAVRLGLINPVVKSR